MGLRALGEALHAWKPARGEVADPLTDVRAAWPEIVGINVAANSRPLEIERDTLLVLTRSNSWSQQLSFLSEQIIAALGARGLQPKIAHVRFRVGKIAARTSAAPARGELSQNAVRNARSADLQREPVATAEEAINRFRADIEAFQRAKRAAGWKECAKCGVLIAPTARSMCSTCADTQAGEREGLVARLLYEAPWLGYNGVVELAAGLTRAEYSGIRDRLLKRWWEALRRALRAGRLSPDGHERLIASSYVLLKSGISPERIAPETVRNLLGAELHDLIYQQLRK